MKGIIESEKAPSVAAFPLSQAVLHDSKYHLEISGQIGIDASTGKLVEGIKEQTRQTIDNIKYILAEVGWSLRNITKVRIFLADMADYQDMNDEYAKAFPSDQPARFALSVSGLPANALVEIECTAAGDEVNQR